MNELKVINNDTQVVPYGVKRKTSPMRKTYILKLIGRCIVLVFCVWLGLLRPQEYDILTDFSGRFSILHALWFVWMVDMFLQIFYVKGHIPLGSQKLFRQRYIPVKGCIQKPAEPFHDYYNNLQTISKGNSGLPIAVESSQVAFNSVCINGLHKDLSLLVKRTCIKGKECSPLTLSIWLIN